MAGVTSVVELRPDPDRPGGWTLLVDGVEQSYVDQGDPRHLEFTYIRQLSWMVDTAAPAGLPVRVLHLGAGALTLPRYVEATRPGSDQWVVDHDPALVELVLRELPLSHPVELVIADARSAVGTFAAGGFDLVIGDVYRAGQMPSSVASAQFAALVADVLRPGGRYAVNICDLPQLAYTRKQAVTLRTAFPDVCLIAEPRLLRGRRYGNLVLAAGAAPDPLPVSRLVRLAAGDPFPARVLHGTELSGFVAGARPVFDADSEDSPLPGPSRFGL